MAQSSLESAGRDMMTVMKTAAFGFKRAYRLTPDRGPADGVVSLVRIDGPASSKTVLLPYSVGLRLSRRADRGDRRCDHRQRLSAGRLGLLSSLWARLRLALLFKEKKFLRHDEFCCFLSRPETGAQTLYHLQPAHAQNRGRRSTVTCRKPSRSSDRLVHGRSGDGAASRHRSAESGGDRGPYLLRRHLAGYRRGR